MTMNDRRAESCRRYGIKYIIDYIQSERVNVAVGVKVQGVLGQRGHLFLPWEYPHIHLVTTMYTLVKVLGMHACVFGIRSKHSSAYHITNPVGIQVPAQPLSESDPFHIFTATPGSQAAPSYLLTSASAGRMPGLDGFEDYVVLDPKDPSTPPYF
jgi:hypothetical protein